MRKIIAFIFLISLSSYSQVGGESIYIFLNLTGSARQAALGGETLTLIDDVNQPLWNPSVINEKLSGDLSINYLNYLADLSYTSISYAHMINKKFGTIQSGITYLNYGKFVGADENGIENGNFKAYDLALSMGYSYKFTNSNFAVGANIKFINSVIDNYSSFGVGADIGILFNDEMKPYIFTIVLRNVGYQVTLFDEYRENLPVQIDLGASYKLRNVPMTWYFTLDNLQKWDLSSPNPSNSETDIDGNETDENISFIKNSLRHFIIGVEIFTKGSFNLRLGYNFRRSKELQLIDKRTFAGFTAGFGIKLKKFKFNYAFSKFHPASNASTFSLLINLN